MPHSVIQLALDTSRHASGYDTSFDSYDVLYLSYDVSCELRCLAAVTISSTEDGAKTMKNTENFEPQTTSEMFWDLLPPLLDQDLLGNP